MRIFNSIAQMKATRAIDSALVTVTGYYTKNDGGGGTFSFDGSSTETPDDGLIFTPTVGSGAGRWKRITSGRKYNFLWWGAKPDGTTDNFPFLTQAITGIPNIPAVPISGYNVKGIIYFPGASGTYKFSQTIIINDLMEFQGDEGIDNLSSTIFEFPTNVRGIHVKPFVSGPRGAYGFVMKDIKLRSTISTTLTASGIYISRPIHFKNVNVEGFSGGGIDINTTIEGIADLCYLENCSAYYNGESGLMTRGVDSNQCTIINFNAFGNYRWGIDEQSFLGNNYFNPHTNVNSNVPGNPVWAFSGGFTYACIQAHINKQPGVASGWQNYWVKVLNPGIVAPAPEFPAWSSSFSYKTGGAYNSAEAASNGSVWVGAYSEGGQPPSAFGQGNLVLGGVNGAGYRSPKDTPMVAGTNGKLLMQSGLRVVVPIDYSTPSEQEISINDIGLNVLPSNNGVVGTPLTLRWDNSIKAFTIVYSNSVGTSAQWFTTSQMPNASDFFGRPTAPDAIPHFQRGLFLGFNDQYSRGRMLEYSGAVPSTGYHAIGDIAFKAVTGPGDTVLGWRCKVAGTPGTWETLYANLTPPA